MANTIISHSTIFTIMVRAFLALEISEEVRAALAGAQEVLRGCRAHLTFVQPAQIHITAKFLGEVDEKKIPAVKEAVRKIKFHQFETRAGRVTVNNPRRPFTVWCTMNDGGNGALLQKEIDDSLSSLGFSREKRPFLAHATVARVKRFDTTLLDALDTLKERRYGECMVTGMKLKKSTLTPSGPVYEDLLEVAW